MEKHLVMFLATLEAARESHHTAHWAVKGPTFFSDHKMFEELYDSLNGPIDDIGERAVLLGCNTVLSASAVKQHAKELLDQWDKEHPDLIDRALAVETVISWCVKHCRAELAKQEDENGIYAGLDNLLIGIADERAKYLGWLTRRAMH